jgi:16S rRNA A1518/A1519 N6-dimethyltransferase RsmA/KsgA/DIM1 with predicted DNA glycosylase/AP lyase activity
MSLIRKLKMSLKCNPLFELIPRKFRIQIPCYTSIHAEDTVIDCGANVGDVSSYLARTGCKVISVEPNPDCVKSLLRRFRFRSNVVVIPKAVSNEEGKKTLYFKKGYKDITSSEASRS